MSISPSASDFDSENDDEASTISLVLKQEEARLVRMQMVQHAAFRRFCNCILVRSLAHSIFRSQASESTRQKLVGKGKRRQLHWWSPRDWIDVNTIQPATGREYREFRSVGHEPWLTDEEVTFENGLTAGFWSGCIEWGMRIRWNARSLFLHDETRSTEDDHRKDRIKYRQTFQIGHLLERHGRDNQLHQGEYRRELVEYEDGSEGFETTFEDPLEWGLDEVTPWKYILKKGRRDESFKFTPELKKVVEENRDPKVLAMREKLFSAGLPHAKARLMDPKVAYEFVDSYATTSRIPYRQTNSNSNSKVKARIRFNPSVYVHGDSIDLDDGHCPAPMVRAVTDPISDRHGHRYRPRHATPSHTYDLYKPALSHLAPGSFRIPIMSLTQIEVQTLSRAGVSSPRARPDLTRKVYKGTKATRMVVRHYEQGCVWHEAVMIQSDADTLLDQRPDWAAKRRQSFEIALSKMGWDTESVRTGVKPVQTSPFRLGRFVPVISRLATSIRTRIRSWPPTPDLDHDNETEAASDLSVEYNCPTSIAGMPPTLSIRDSIYNWVAALNPWSRSNRTIQPLPSPFDGYTRFGARC